MTTPAADASKQEWRRWARRRAAGLGEEAGRRMLDHAARYLRGLEPTTVVLYSALPGELGVDELAAVPGHRFALTRTPGQGWLTIHPWDAPRERHRYGFSQPVAAAAEISLGGIGVVMIPGLAFDRRGVRLGRGAGYYDELASRLPASVRLVGIVPAALVVDRLPREPHDLAVDVLITEEGVVDVVGPKQ